MIAIILAGVMIAMARAIRMLRIIDYIHWQRKFSLVEMVLAIVVAMVIIDAKKWILHRLELMILYWSVTLVGEVLTQNTTSINPENPRH